MKYLVSIFVCMAIASMTNAQDKETVATALENTPSMEISNDLLAFNKKTQQGFTSYLKCSQSLAEKKWKEFISNKYQAEAKKTKGGLISESISMADIASSPMTVTALFSEDENGCKMNVFYNMNGYYLSTESHKKESAAVMASLKTYQRELYVVAYQETLDAQRKVQDGNQKTRDKLVKEEEKLTKEVASEEAKINKADQAIIDSEKKITELQAKMEELRGEIEKSKSTIEELKEAKVNKAKEIANQNKVVAGQTTRITKLKTSAERLSN